MRKSSRKQGKYAMNIVKVFRHFCQLAPLAAAMLALFASCQDTLRSPEPANAGPGGKAVVTITLNAGAERSVLPQVSLADVSKYTLLGGKSGAAAAQLAEFGYAANAQISLEPGTWSFTLNAYNSANALILQGTAQNRSISLTGNNTVTFTLLPLESGQGAISITVDCPSVIARVSAAVDGGAESGARVTLTGTTGGKRVVYADTISAGSYFVALRFYDGDDTLRGTVSELVLVRGNVTSTKTLALAAGDLKAEDGVFLAAPDSSGFLDTLSGIQGNTTEDHFIIIVTTDMNLAPQNLSGAGYQGKTITVRGDTAGRTITLASNGSLFTVGEDVTLKLANITLIGRNNNNSSLIKVDGGTLVLNSGGTISGNTVYNADRHVQAGYTNSSGGGVFVSSTGKFTMNDGAISGNTASSSGDTFCVPYSYGGGVFVAGGGIFTIKGGAISGNTASSTDTARRIAYSYGGGVFMVSGEMSGGTISGNTASASSTRSSSTPADVASTHAYSYGGGVYASGGNFTMSNGTISGNEAVAAALSNGSSSPFLMADAAAYSYGGGVYMGSGSFTMTDGTINNNMASASASGYNTSRERLSYGGGVYLDGSGVFTKTLRTNSTTSGIIYGSDVNDALNNTAANGGTAVYYAADPAKARNTTLGETDSISTASDEGWE